MPTIFVPLFAALFALVVWAEPAAAAPIYTIQTFTVPNAVSFNVIAVNNTGELVGTLRQPNDMLAGFIDTIATGTITTFAGTAPVFPPALGTTVIGLNDSGTILATTPLLGYTLRSPDGTLTAAPIPAAAGTPTAINNANQVTANVTASMSSKADLVNLQTGAYAFLNTPAGVSTIAQGLNNLGQVVGQYRSASGQHGFFYDPTTASFTLTPDPAGSISTDLFAIDDVGQAVGEYIDSNSNIVGFLFNLATNTETILPFVGVGINNAGQIVGNLSPTVGFIATAQALSVPEPATLLLLTSLLMPAFVIRRAK